MTAKGWMNSYSSFDHRGIGLWKSWSQQKDNAVYNVTKMLEIHRVDDR